MEQPSAPRLLLLLGGQMARRRWTPLSVLMVALATWFLLGPSDLGGPATYVSTYGISMQPTFEAGDLAILKPAVTYSPGDVAGYEADTLNRTLVMHRIVETDGNQFVFKGDNNSWLDPDQPTRDQIVGKLWLQIPGGGIWLERLTSPPFIAALAFLILLTVGSAAAYAGRGRRRRRRSMAGSNPSGQAPSWWMVSPRLQPFMTAALAAAGFGLLLALFAFTRPTTTSSTEKRESSKEVAFSYNAPVPQTPAYEGTEATSPDPVFRKVANIVNVVVDYQGPPGTMGVDAKLSTSSGWRWTLPLTAPQPFDQEQHSATVTLNLAEIEQRAKAGAEAAGIPAGDVTVTIAPTISSTTGDFRPELPMQLSATEFSMTGDVDSLTASEPTSAQVTTEKPASLSFLGLSIPVAVARLVSMILMALGVVAAAAIAVISAKGPPPAESEIVRRRYKNLVVPVTQVPAPVGAVIEVPDIDTLAKLAKRYALLILHGVQDGRDVYLIQDESTTYRYLGEAHVAEFDDFGGAAGAEQPVSAAQSATVAADSAARSFADGPTTGTAGLLAPPTGPAVPRPNPGAPTTGLPVPPPNPGAPTTGLPVPPPNPGAPTTGPTVPRTSPYAPSIGPAVPRPNPGAPLSGQVLPASPAVGPMPDAPFGPAYPAAPPVSGRPPSAPGWPPPAPGAFPASDRDPGQPTKS